MVILMEAVSKPGIWKELRSSRIDPRRGGELITVAQIA